MSSHERIKLVLLITGYGRNKKNEFQIYI